MGVVLKAQYRRCVRCDTEAEVIAGRALTPLDLPEIGTGPTLNAVVLLCGVCNRSWIVLAADTGEWYGIGGGD